MEKVISQEERIRRAEEIYSRRKYENNYIASNKTGYEPATTTIKHKMLKKMMVQIIVCTIIYFLIYTIQHSNQIFSADVINKAKEILLYDINLQNLYNMSTEYINGIQNKLLDNNERQSQEQVNVEENTEDIEQEINNIENNEQEAVGGAEEVAIVEEKSQEEIDIEYVKQNANIIWPLTGIITSRFGTRTPTEIVTANHYGIDIAGNIGDDIICAMDGTVTLSSSEGDYGKHIRVENGEIITLYAHCNTLLVNEGDVVKQGVKIAEVGETGRATGPHLHFEIKRENRFINPEDILGTM